MKSTLSILKVVLIVLIIGCESSNTEIPIDGEKWKSDPNGCQGIRMALKDQLIRSKEHLIGLSQQDIIGILGKPDMNQLDNRSKKSYLYFIEGAAECNSDSDKSTKLVIEFNSINQVRFVTFQKW